MKKRMNRSGFSLIETLIALALVIVVIGGAAGLFTFYIRNYSFSFEQQQSVGSAATTLTAMLREIREARIAENGSWPIVEALDDSFTFYSDVTNDNRVDRVRYFLDGNTLKKGVVEPVGVPATYPLVNEQIRTVATEVYPAGNPVFIYYNGNWPGDTVNNPLPAASRVLETRYVNIFIRIDTEHGKGSAAFETNSGVQLRNLKDNL
jgi:type II secretory pathway pseudopilin PulG